MEIPTETQPRQELSRDDIKTLNMLVVSEMARLRHIEFETPSSRLASRIDQLDDIYETLNQRVEP